MSNVNKVFLMGRLTRDPELRYTPGGMAVTNISMAMNRKYKAGETMKEDVCYVRVVVWGKQGEVCAEYLKKGNPVFVEGRLQSRSWEQPDGQKRFALDIVAENVQFLGTKKKEERSPQDEPPREEMF